MDKNNPYRKKQTGLTAPLLNLVPLYDFDSGPEMEQELQPEELCVARMPNNINPLGYTHHVALVYKSKDGEVFSLTFAQHHGELKPGTVEHFKQLEEEESNKDPLPSIQGKQNGSRFAFFRKKT